MRTLLLLLTAPVLAQGTLPLPGLGGQDDEKTAITVAGDPDAEVKRLRKLARDNQQGLLLRAQDAQAWEEKRAGVRERLASLEAQRRELVRDEAPAEDERAFVVDRPAPPPAPPQEADAGLPPPEPPPPEVVTLPALRSGEAYLAPRVHPAQLAALDALVAMLTGFEESYSALLRLYADERARLNEALAEADRLLEPPPEVEQDDKERPDLKILEKLALDAHLAGIELSLARARHRQAQGDDDDDATSEPKEPDPLPALDSGGARPAAAFGDSYRAAEALHDELDRWSGDQSRLWQLRGELRGTARRARELRFRLALIAAERVAEQREEALRRGLARLQVSAADQARAEQVFERSVSLRAESIPRIEARRDETRARMQRAGPGAFSVARVAQVEDALLAERLAFERLKLQRDTFRKDLVPVLKASLEGALPPREFRERYEPILEPKAHRRRVEDLGTRCDGWRRAETEAQKAETAGPEAALRKKGMLDSYAALQDVCTREEWVFATEERLASIARYHFDRLKWEARGFGWYAWRTLLSLLLAALCFLLSRLAARLTRRLAAGGSASRPGLQRLRRTLALLLYLGGAGGVWVLVAAWAAGTVWDAPLAEEQLLGWAEHPLFYVGDRAVSAWSMLQVGGFALAGVWLGSLLRGWISGSLLEHFQIERGIRDAVGAIVRYAVIFAGVGMGLAAVGIGWGAVAVVFGVIGIGIGFGLQQIASNFISGFIILLERPIRKGDFVQVGEMIGEVKEISARATTIETRDAVSVIVPNSEFITNRVVNWTLGGGEKVRIAVNVGVAYGSDVELVERLLLEAGDAHRDVLSHPAPAVHFARFDDSALAFTLFVWTRRIRHIPDLVSDLNRAVDAAFRAHDVTIPFPQRTLHIERPGESE